MAVAEQTPYIDYTANGATTSFALGFDCESKDHLIVLIDDIEPPIATWSLTGGNVVFTTAPADGKKITIQRNTPFSRNTDYQSYNNSFRPPAVNKDFDWIWWKLQELGVADWILSNRIDALKNYVDDRDDELRAYLLEEIRKQGVALDQLEDYYNYLMQRLAEIAVNAGWEASFVVDASGKTQQQLNNLFKNVKLIDTRLYGLVVDTPDDQTAAIQAAFTENPNNQYFYIPKGVVKANIVFPRAYMYLVGDGLLNTIIEPFDLTKPPVSFNKKLYSGLVDLTVQAPQEHTAESVIDATEVRYMYLENVDVRKTIQSGQTHAYQGILIDNRAITGSWTGYNKLKNVRAVYGAYGYLSDVDKLNSVLEMDGCLFSFNGYFNIKTSASNSTLINMDIANGGKLQPNGTYDETQYGGMYIKGDNSVINGVWHELNAQTGPSYNSNNLYIHPDSWNITHNFARDTRGTNNVRVYTQSQGQLQDVNTADRSLNDGQGRARPQQLIKNGNFAHWDSALSRPKGWGGYFSGTWTQETADLPKGYNTGLKVVSNVAGVCGIYQAIYNPDTPDSSYIKDISKWVGREITVSFFVKNIGTSTTSIRGGISTDTTNVYFSSGNFVSATKVGEWTKVVAAIKVTGSETRIWAGVRVSGVGEGMIVTGFSVADDCRVNDSQAKAITEDGGEVFGNLEVRGTLTNNGVSPVFRPTAVTTAGLSSASNSINTADKYLGKQVFNNTNSLMYYATGTTPTSAWKSFDSTSTITPA